MSFRLTVTIFHHRCLYFLLFMCTFEKLTQTLCQSPDYKISIFNRLAWKFNAF